MYYRQRPTGLDPLLTIITVTVAIYLVSIFTPQIISSFGLQPASFLERPWTLVTHMFIHGDIFHIMFNMLALYFFGGYLLRLVSNRDFLIIYFGGGIIGGLVYVLLGTLGNPLVIAIGASGAVFALGGSLAILTPNIRVYIIPIPVPLPLWVAVIGGFAILSFLPGIAWQGHLGGLLFGLGAGYLIRNRRRYY